MSAGMVLSSLPLSAAVVHECTSGQPTAASYQWDFRKEANGIFQDIEREVRQASSQAARLQSYGQSPDIAWEAHAEKLMELRTEINDIGARLCRLETIRRVLAPWQQKTVDHIAAQAREASANAEEAIRFLNAHQSDLWMPAYQDRIRNLYNEAQALQHLTGEAVQYARVNNQYQALKKVLG